jgi:mannosyltransferase OCH1-like enzyme
MAVKIIHALWDKKPVPRENNYSCAWPLFNPDAEVRIWSFEEAFQEVLLKNHPDLIEAYAQQWLVGKAGMLRYAIIQEFGGFYMDLDIELRKPFTPLWDEDLVFQFCYLPGLFTDPRHCQIILDCAFYASRPHHPFFDALFEHCKADKRVPVDSRMAAFQWGAAPLIQVFGKHPELTYTNAELTAWVKTTEHYGVHWSKQTWKDRKAHG